MSLLLDALKKAALEKQRRDLAGNSSAPDDPDDPAEALQPPTLARRMDRAAVSRHHSMLTHDRETSAVLESASEQSAEQEGVEAIEQAAPVTSRSGALTSRSATSRNSASADTQPGFTPARGKAALAQLLISSEQAHRRTRRRRSLALVALVMTAGALPGGYYYFLSITNSSLTTNAIPVQRDRPPQPQVAALVAVTDTGRSSAIKDQDAMTANLSTGGDVAATTPIDTVIPAQTAKPDKPAMQPTTIRLIERQPGAQSPVDTDLQAGYRAYQSGDLNAAQEAYQRALTRDPQQRDALLGLAAIYARQGDTERALATYQQRLSAASNDPDARAGLLGLFAADNPDPALDSELNRLLGNNPDSAYLHFLKGNLAAARAQWTQAQLAYFDAVQRDAHNPDYAFNLAVALDHLAQPREALRYYRLALSLLEEQPSKLDAATTRRRIATLEVRLP